MNKTLEEVFQDLERGGESMNFLTTKATEMGVDFDENTKDEFNRDKWAMAQDIN